MPSLPHDVSCCLPLQDHSSLQRLISLKGISVSCIIGALPEERASEQELIIQIDYSPRMWLSASTDQLADTIDYREIVTLCEEVCQSGQYYLIEKLGHELFHALWNSFNLTFLSLTAIKQSPLPTLASSSITLSRHG